MMARHLAEHARHTVMPGLDAIIASEWELEAVERQARDAALSAVLRGLRSEDDSTQLRAIVAEVTAMLARPGLAE